MANIYDDHKKKEDLVLFGGSQGWHDADWTASDDRVRGGKSQSYFDCSEKSGRFHGTLDIKTLGGAGFASQRTTGDDQKWDLSAYAGLQINVAKGDKKRYTLTVKDTLLPPSPDDGREQSTISWECDFELPPQAEPGHTTNRQIFIPWESFNPTFRGRLKKDAHALDTKSIKRLSLLMRSFFGTQEGDFSITITSIKALVKVPTPDGDDDVIVNVDALEKGDGDIDVSNGPNRRGFFAGFPWRTQALTVYTLIVFGLLYFVILPRC
nr:hypothetical protein B0A51_17445 [Rachicladosporium sp. CCFEE 5018]